MSDFKLLQLLFFILFIWSLPCFCTIHYGTTARFYGFKVVLNCWSPFSKSGFRNPFFWYMIWLDSSACNNFKYKKIILKIAKHIIFILTVLQSTPLRTPLNRLKYTECLNWKTIETRSRYRNEITSYYRAVVDSLYFHLEPKHSAWLLGCCLRQLRSSVDRSLLYLFTTIMCVHFGTLSHISIVCCWGRVRQCILC
jgi:hypothetical protein